MAFTPDSTHRKMLPYRIRLEPRLEEPPRWFPWLSLLVRSWLL